MRAIIPTDHESHKRPRVAPPRRPRSERILVIALMSIFALIVVGVVAVVVWVLDAEPTPPAATIDYEGFRPAWESAMAKAGVEATFPVVPVQVEDLQVSGFATLDATFTAEEVTALATMYRYAYETPQGTVSLLSPRVGFPADGRVSFTGRLSYQGSTYRIEGSVDANIQDTRLVTDPETARLEIAGFTLDGERRSQALQAVEEYLEALIGAAPRLTIIQAEIREGVLHVEGAVPRRLVDLGGE